MANMILRAAVIGAAALLLAVPVVTADQASAAQWRGGVGGFHAMAWRNGGAHIGHVWGGAWRGGGQARAWGAGRSFGAASGWGGGGKAWAWGVGRSVGAASGWRDDHASRVWHAGRRIAGTWYGGWWGPGGGAVAVSGDDYSLYGPDSTCTEVQPVYSAYGNYLGRQIINTCD